MQRVRWGYSHFSLPATGAAVYFKSFKGCRDEKNFFHCACPINFNPFFRQSKFKKNRRKHIVNSPKNIQWNAKNQTSEIGKTPKFKHFECPSFDVRLHDLCPKSELILLSRTIDRSCLMFFREKKQDQRLHFLKLYDN